MRVTSVIDVILLALLAGAVVYSLLSIAAAYRYLSVARPADSNFEPISILKPLAGADLHLESNLRTFFEQDYPSFELLFAVRDANDPAVAVVERLRGEYAHVPAQILVTGEPPYPNAKAFSLSRMLQAAANDLVVMSDSDTRVTPDLLRTISGEFLDQQVAVATCPYRAVPGPSLWSRLEATGMNTDFIAGILVARMLEGMRFAVGPTATARRSTLQSIGGFERMKDYLAEDFVMGKFAAEAGHGVILSSYVIEHHIGDSNLSRTSRTVCAGPQHAPLPTGWLCRTAFHHASSLGDSGGRDCPALMARFPASRGASLRGGLRGFCAGVAARLNWLLLPPEDLFEFVSWVAGFFGIWCALLQSDVLAPKAKWWLLQENASS